MPQAYDPTSPQPYIPEQQPDNIKPAVESPFGGQPGTQLQGMGRISHGGAAAGLFDNMLRGAVNGYAMGEAQKAMRLKKKSDDLNASYNSDAARLYQLHQAGVDEKSPEYQQAKSSVDGSWGALQDFRGQMLEQQGGKKKSKKTNGQDPHPVQVVTDPNASPQEKAAAVYALSQKAGAPVYGQIAMSAAQKKQQENSPEGQLHTATTQNQLNQQQLIQQRDQILAVPEAQRTAAQTSQLQAIESRMTPEKGAASHGAPVMMKGLDGKLHPMQWVNGEYVPVKVPEGYEPVAKATGKTPVEKFYRGEDGRPMSVRVDPATNQVIPGSQNSRILPPASMMQHVSQGFYVYQDPETGNIIKEPITRSSGPIIPGGGSPSAASGGEPTLHPRGGSGEPLMVTQSFQGKTVPGMVKPGNVDLSKRPNIDNGDGTHSSVFSMSFGTDEGEVLVPGVGDGKTYPLRKLTTQEALDQYRKTGANLGVFKDEKAANAYGKTLHEDQAKYGNAPHSSGRPASVRHEGGEHPLGTVIGHKGEKAATKEEADKLEHETSEAYEKAIQTYNKAKEAAETTTGLSAADRQAARVRAATALSEENARIGAEHERRRLIYANQAPTPSAARPAANQPPPQNSDRKSRTIYKHGKSVGTMDLTEDEVKALASDPDFTKQGGSIR